MYMYSNATSVCIPHSNACSRISDLQSTKLSTVGHSVKDVFLLGFVLELFISTVVDLIPVFWLSPSFSDQNEDSNQIISKSY